METTTETIDLDKLKKQLTRYWEDPERRQQGLDWPDKAETMIGLDRLDNLQYCIEQALKDNVPGDLIETGIWRGGAVVLMRAVLKAHNDPDRVVWGADSFQGLPRPDPIAYPADLGDKHFENRYLAVEVGEVLNNIAKYGMLDDRVRLLQGWFKDTLPQAPIEKLAVLRLDGDMYQSTWEALDALYPKLSPGGFCVIDDWGIPAGCQQAVVDYRRQHDVQEEIIKIDALSVYWRKNAASS